MNQPEPGYHPLPSVWQGTDAELLEAMLDFYPSTTPERILDATVNTRRFWRRSTRQVLGLDINPTVRPDIIADNSALPFRDGVLDVIVYDPPHIPDQGRQNNKDFQDRFGLTLRSNSTTSHNISAMFPAFMQEAHRVLKSTGLLFCKTIDYVHSQHTQWAHVHLIQAGAQAGLTPCDCIIKIRPSPIIDPKWKKARHARKQHSYWIIFRNSTRCH